jgi:hypothetical protein
MVWENVRIEGDALQAVVREDDCTGQTGAELVWIRIARP